MTRHIERSSPFLFDLERGKFCYSSSIEMNAAVESNSDESEDEYEESPEVRLKRLVDRKEDLIENLNGVDASLAKLGYQIDNRAVKQAKRQLQSGIRMKNKLSFRGEEMCAEYFAFLDEDNDGYLGWEDFRAMRTLAADFIPEVGGFNHYPEFGSWESWRMYMKDLGVRCDKLGRVNLKEFINYRAIVEAKQPLARELESLCLGFLPFTLALWKNINGMIQEALVGKTEKGRRDAVEGRGLQYEDIHFILSNVGITYTYPEYLTHMKTRAQIENLHETLHRRFLRLRYHQSPARYSQMLEEGNISQRPIALTIDHMKYTKLHKLTSWIFSDRPEPTRKQGLYHDLLVMKYRAHRSIRYWDRITKLMFSIGFQIRLRRVFDDFKPVSKLTAVEASKSVADIEVEVQGSGGNIDGGLSIEWSSMKVDHPEQFLMNHKLPRESGACLILEFMVKPDATDEKVEHASHKLLAWVKTHFDKELKANVQFRGLFCFPAHSEGDGCKVIRFAISYKRIVSFDAWMSQMILPYSLNDLLCSLSGSFKTNLQLADIFSTTSNFQLDTTLTARLELSAQYRVLPIVGILRRLNLALSSGYTTHQTRPDSEDANELMRRKLKQYYPDVIEWATWLESVISGQKAINFKFVFRKLSDLLSRVGNANTWFNQTFPSSMGSEQGFVTKIYSAWQKAFMSQYHEIFDPLAAHLRDKVSQEEKDQEKEKQRSLFEVNDGGKTDKSAEAPGSSGVMDKLKMLGIEMDEDDVMAEDAHDPASLILNANNRLIKNDIAALECMEECYDVLVGLHNAQLLLGKFKLNVGISGLDFVECIPKIPSMKDVKKECEDRRTAMRERSAAAMKEERMARIKAREEAEAKAASEERKRERELRERD